MSLCGSSPHHTPAIAERARRARRTCRRYDGPMETAPMRDLEHTRCCVVLMMKSPTRSKRRLVEHLGARRATEIAERLLDCAREDLTAWPGPTCVAPSTADERADGPPA